MGNKETKKARGLMAQCPDLSYQAALQKIRRGEVQMVLLDGAWVVGRWKTDDEREERAERG